MSFKINMLVVKVLSFLTIFFCCLLAPVFAESSTSVVLKNDLAILEINSLGVAKSLKDKENSRELLGRMRCFFDLQVGEKNITPQLMRVKNKSSDLYIVSYDDGKIIVTYRITIKKRYFVFEIVDITGSNYREVESVSLVRLSPITNENIGYLIPAYWDKKSAVSLIGLTDKVRTKASKKVSYLDARAYKEFGFVGQKVALIVAPSKDLFAIIEEIENEYKIPVSRTGGVNAKKSADIRTSYLFIDLTSSNVDKVIEYAKKGGFSYVMPYVQQWSSSLGSYSVNTKKFPKGDESLKKAIKKLHDNGLKVGLHNLSVYVSKADPLVSPVPHPGLHKDAENTLAVSIDKNATEIVATSVFADKFPREEGYYNDPIQGMQVQIGNEIILYTKISNDGKRLLEVTRGYNGTRKANHKQGATIQHLTQRHKSYIVDLGTELKDVVANRLAELVNNYGVDMLYFDGGDSYRNVEDHYWYWGGKLQMAVMEKIKEDVLIQGSGITPWSWHMFSRMNSGDMARLASKLLLDRDKIPKLYKKGWANLMPGELGWWGIHSYAPDCPATMPDEVELHAVRMLALDTPISLQTTVAHLEANGRSEEMLGLLGKYEKMRIEGTVPLSVRDELKEGEWHLSEVNGKSVFNRIRYDKHYIVVPSKLQVINYFNTQPFQFRLRVAPKLAGTGEPDNIKLFTNQQGTEIPVPDKSDFTSGVIAFDKKFLQEVDLKEHRALAITLLVESDNLKGKGVLNVQLQNRNKLVRDYFVDLDFTGKKTVVIPRTTIERGFNDELRPHPKNYHLKRAYSGFDYGKVEKLNIRWMRLPEDSSIKVKVFDIEGLKEGDSQVVEPEIILGKQRIKFPVTMSTGEYIELNDDGKARVFDKNNNLLEEVIPIGGNLSIPAGINNIEFAASSKAPVIFTFITIGKQG